MWSTAYTPLWHGLLTGAGCRCPLRAMPSRHPFPCVADTHLALSQSKRGEAQQ
jgi:hypothetical protein